MPKSGSDHYPEEEKECEQKNANKKNSKKKRAGKKEDQEDEEEEGVIILSWELITLDHIWHHTGRATSSATAALPRPF